MRLTIKVDEAHLGWPQLRRTGERGQLYLGTV